MSAATTIRAAAAFEVATLRRSAGDLLVLATTPLLTVVFLSILRHAGRHDIQAYAVLAPGVMAMWSIGVMICGEMVDNERANGTLELLLASPATLSTVIFGRIVVVSVLSLIAVAESWLVAALGFGVLVSVPHPALCAATLVVGALATAGWATAMAGVFVLARSARLFQNSISYPVFVLGGALVPVATLPTWLHVPSRVVYLSWVSDLLRDSLSAASPGHVWARLLVVVGLGAAGYLAGVRLLRAVAVRVRSTGQATYA